MVRVPGRCDADDDRSGAAEIPESIARRDDLDDHQWEAVRTLEEVSKPSGNWPNGPGRVSGWRIALTGACRCTAL